MHALSAIAAATVAWFICAAVLFFNPIVDKIYRSQEDDPAVRSLPQNGKTIGMILLAVAAQCLMWAFVYDLVEAALPGDRMTKGLTFGLILTLTKIVPRDIDRLLLTTYPGKRMGIEFVIGIICSVVVGLVFAYMP